MRVASLVLLAAVQIGCAQYMAIKQPGPIDRSVLAPGVERTTIAGTLGAPTVTTQGPQGRMVDTYNYTDGGRKNTTLPKAGRVVLYTAGDVFTLFLDQILWMPAELLLDGTDYSATVEYEWRPSDGNWIAARITEKKMEGDKETRVLEREPTASSAPAEAAPAVASEGSAPRAGTCFAISGDGLVLTANHVIGNAESAEVSLEDGRRLTAAVERRSVAADVALLRLPGATPRHLGLVRGGSLAVGQRVFTISYAETDPATDPLAEHARFSEGSIAGLTGPGDDSTYVQITIPVKPGDAGGPLVNEEGSVVGIVTGSTLLSSVDSADGLPPNVSWAVNADYVSPLVGPLSPVPPAGSREAAVEQTQAALCQVRVAGVVSSAPSTAH